MESILEKIVGRVKDEQGPLFRSFDPASFLLEKRNPPIDVAALCERSFLIIAEVKKGSPSRGIIRREFDPVAVARSYEEGGASAVSVITEKNFFFGDKNSLRLVKRATRLPVLRKDFIVHEYQIYESYNLGADFILLIAACLSAGELRRLHRVAESLGMRTLVEIHDEADLSKALEAKPRLIGINNRDLKTFAVDWTASLRLRPLVPAGIHVISESGIDSHDQIRILQERGFSGVLVGEYLMRQADPRRALRELKFGRTAEEDPSLREKSQGARSPSRSKSGPEAGVRSGSHEIGTEKFKTPDPLMAGHIPGGSVKVKICGLTNGEDLRLATELGADCAGFIFYRPSPRFIEPSTAAAMIREAKRRPGRRPLFVGVFVDESIPAVRRVFDECGLDIVQLHGDETPEYCRNLHLPYWKGVRLKDESSLLELERFPGSTFLLDSYAEGTYGGSGRPFSMELASKALERSRAVILAGGISVGNLKQALSLRPLAVDVCSLLEERPGKKSEQKMREFFQKINELRNRS